MQQEERMQFKDDIQTLLRDQTAENTEILILDQLRNNRTAIINQLNEFETRLRQIRDRQMQRAQRLVASGVITNQFIDDVQAEGLQNQNERNNLRNLIDRDINEQQRILTFIRAQRLIGIQNIKNAIRDSLNQAIIQEQAAQANINYQTPPPQIDLIRRLGDLNREQQRLQRRAEHAIRNTGEFIFDYDNMCNNLGITNIFGQLELYGEIQHFVGTGQLPNNAVIPVERYGLFQDFNNIPELEEVNPPPPNQLIFTYGRNRLTILLPVNPMNPADPHHLLGQGTFGMIYQGRMNADIIVIKRLINVPDLASVVRETVIQAHLYCQYDRIIQAAPNVNRIARIPKIVSISKYRDEYYIGMIG